jgi:hypothetical protein
LIYAFTTLTPRDVDRCTPVELLTILRAAETRDDGLWRRTAQLAVWMLAPWSKKKLTVDKLLKKRPPAPPLIPGDVLPRRLPDGEA